MTFGVVLFTLLIQSTTVRGLIHQLRIITRSEVQVEYETNHARLAALRLADNRLDRMHNEGTLSSHAWEQLKQYVNRKAEELMSSVRGLIQSDPGLEADQLEKGWRELLRSQRGALLGLRQDGLIADDVYQQLVAEVDAQLINGVLEETNDGKPTTQFMDVNIPDGANAAEKIVADLEIPRSAVLVSVRRGKATFIPRGDTQLVAGDVITVLCDREAISDVRKILTIRRNEE
jgi:NhaP-type Na+/H+ or K+/H+ antiporter